MADEEVKILKGYPRIFRSLNCHPTISVGVLKPAINISSAAACKHNFHEESSVVFNPNVNVLLIYDDRSVEFYFRFTKTMYNYS